MTALSESKIEELSKRFGRWTKETAEGKKYDRIYFNAKDLGMVVEYYKTGNVRNAEVNGDSISNSQARRLMASKAYYDVASGQLVIDSEMEEYFGDQIRELLK